METTVVFDVRSERAGHVAGSGQYEIKIRNDETPEDAKRALLDMFARRGHTSGGQQLVIDIREVR